MALARLHFDLKMGIGLILGAAPLLVLSLDNRERYLAFSLTLTSSVGVMTYLREKIKCTSAISDCSFAASGFELAFATIFYLVLLVGGLWQMRKVVRRNEAIRRERGGVDG